MAFSGITTFAHMPNTACLIDPLPFDIGIIGFPFDTAVSYRPGARFGPKAIRDGSRRLRTSNGWSMHWKVNPYDGTVALSDCGDVPITPYDNSLALEEMEIAYDTLLSRKVAHEGWSAPLSLDGSRHPFILTLGGDHTIVYPILRSLHRRHGPITVLHFDSHIDTWPPSRIPSSSSSISQITHGTFFWKAATEGLIANNSVHAGIRSKFEGPYDLEHDKIVGFDLIATDEMDEVGALAIIERIRHRIGHDPLYVSIDIDVLDPAFAPGTGTPEPGGWTSREMKRLLRGLEGLNIVGADIVEVSPAYDSGDITGIAAADLAHELLSLVIVGKGARNVAGQRRWHSEL
ncbi:related to agmatinase [Serendipita indica DSM 11827]|uniref:Related to agmatinase n=1 Tax=Serendipita indica (strain DSM 11827) TaxID=1109443 RepID=G4TPM6_SERID|nr:related to agmatinase [Serendipita indica DSM 11827]